jgi:transposase
VENTALAPAQKKAEQEQRTIVFVDEAGFSLLPMIVRTYALRGQTPVLRVKLTRDHLSAIGGITPRGRLFLQMQERASKAEDVVRFVPMLLRTISGKLLIMWDGSPLHRAEVVKPFLSSFMGKRVHLERLPGDAPDLHPQERVWNVLKRRERKNRCVGIWLTCVTRWFVPRNAFGIGTILFSIALPMLLLRFRCLSRGQ